MDGQNLEWRNLTLFIINHRITENVLVVSSLDKCSLHDALTDGADVVSVLGPAVLPQVLLQQVQLPLITTTQQVSNKINRM